MPDFTPDRVSGSPELSPVKRALHEIRALRARVDELESARHESIAIIGMGLRFPGGVIDEASFWNLLAEGRDAITEIPRDRWDWRAYFHADPDAPGSMITQHGGFLTGVDLFDASFFGVSPREAVAMDPQHRLALEVAWQALENAGYSPAVLQDTPTGIFLGIGNHDYGRSALADIEHIDAYTGSGNSPAMVAGRLSYVLGLHGPSLAVDTSCSSSLVAVHLACQGLRAGECKLALAGGVNLILTPELNIALSKAHMMARDGHCKTFDEAADGYVRGEGCGIVVLKKLSDAISDGDRILSVIRGSAVNHDGRSGGLTAPNGPAQAAVIRAALEVAQVNPAEIGYLETHGTGTALGDPIEVETLASVMGSGRPADTPLVIGSVKTNIGHLESASGVAGLMKAVLALQHHAVPPSLHLKQKSSHIDWERLPIVVPTQVVDWNPPNGLRYAGVSSFGFSGTNAHVVLQEAPQAEHKRSADERSRHILTLSARTETALSELRERYAVALRATSTDVLADFCYTANFGRADFAHRMAVVGETSEQMASALEAAENVVPAARIFTGVVEDGDVDRVCFLCTGQGSQYVGMGQELYSSSPVYRAAIERCAVAWKEQTGESLIEVLYPPATESGRAHAERGMKQARYAQASLYALEYGLAELWRSWGIEPSVVLGHSLGEYVAAVIAGIFSVEDGLRLVCARARLMDTLTQPGAMRSIGATAERVQQEIAGLESEVGIGVINGPESVVLSGLAGTVERVAKSLEADGIRTRALEVTHAFHSPLLEPILEEFESCARQVKYHAPRIRIISNLTGKTARADEMTTARYWREHMRRTVQFDAGLTAALETGCQTLLEIGPQPHLKALAVRSHASLESRIKISLRRQRNDWDHMLETLAIFYVDGHKIDWRGFDQGKQRTRRVLPTYPFERQRYWLHSEDSDVSLRRWQRATESAVSQSKLVPIGVSVESFAEKWMALERLTIAEILRTLRGLGAFTTAGVSHDAASLAASCGILPAHRKLMGRWLLLLCEAGYLQRDGLRFLHPAMLPDPDMDQAWRDAERCLADDPFLLEYLRNCSKNLRGVLLGTTSPLETLFPGGSPDLARNLYENSSGARYANLIVAAAVQAIINTASAKRRLQVLELGGGTGATTAAILPNLAPDRASYHFTDVSEVFLQRAGARFVSYPFVRYGLLDIENEAHLAARRGAFDVVIAANVVHATRDLQATLSGIASLLAPGGVMVLLESTREFAWHDITTGLIEGWQKSDDDLRAGAALLGVAEWSSALHAAGLDRIVSAPEPESAAGIIGLHVILATRSATNNAIVTDTIGTLNPAYMPQESAWTYSSSVDAAPPDPVEVPEIAALLEDLPQSERRALLLDVVLKEIAQVLRLGANSSPRKRDRLMELGMDSLMAVELRNRLSRLLHVDSLPATLIFDYPTPEAIVTCLLDRMYPEIQAGGEMSSSVPVATEKFLTAEEVADLSDEDVSALLRSRLA